MNSLYAGFLEIAKTAVPYFAQWTYNEPMVVTLETNNTMRFLQQAMYKAIRHFAENYENYGHLMPLSERTSKILAMCKDVSYRTGTYRTDFLIDESRHIWLMEITCRFALNGLLRAGFMRQMVDSLLASKPPIQRVDQYSAFFDFFSVYLGDFSRVCFLKNDSFNESRYFIPLFESIGYPVQVLEMEDIPQSLDLLDGSAIIGQLRQDEWCSLPLDVVDRLVHTNMLNDLRTVFLIHDKRFFSVLQDDDFLRAAMSKAESERFRAHLVPTWGWHERRDLWEQARQVKNGWIIKPRSLGMGIGVKAGPLTEQADWESVFEQDDVEDLTLQPYISQARFHGRVGNEERYDYIVGTLLTFENHFFGPGVFRASSHPVTNQGDTRRLAHVVTNDTQFFDPEKII